MIPAICLSVIPGLSKINSSGIRSSAANVFASISFLEVRRSVLFYVKILICFNLKTSKNGWKSHYLSIICIPRFVDNIIIFKKENRGVFFISVNLQYRSSNHRRSQQKSHHQKNIDWNLLRHQRSRSEPFASLDSQSSIHEHRLYGI